MSDTQGKLHTEYRKRRLLIAEDERLNREILAGILEDDYELVFAGDGRETIEEISRQKDFLSMVLLDLMMPVYSGIEVLRLLKEDPALRRIPVIVMTSDQKAEVECLTLGAVDFIPKPYPQPEVIRARILRTIELFEDRQTIRSTERDPVTGLYNREYFYSYAQQYDQYHPAEEMDAILIDVNHFHIINERFGTTFGDEILKKIGANLYEVTKGPGTFVCRREADTFLIYCSHRDDYETILEAASVMMGEGESHGNRVRIRMGVYPMVDKSLKIERRFDRAKMASIMGQTGMNRPVGIYDQRLHERQIYEEQLLEGFHKAIQERQFQIYFQPKFNIQGDQPVLASAEALVRWEHPQKGTISPALFVPLFEENGLIQSLDTYVWERTSAYIREWKKDYGHAIPISVNVSRVDMYDPCLVDSFRRILAENELVPDDLLLEVTESAYAGEVDQIIDTVKDLRKMGFKIEMDDFGSGYSSLNMLSTLPVDVLKLDMEFIRNAFRCGKDTGMLEIILDIADYLSVPVIAEGVETEEQMRTLKELGCEFVQGYYFSRPIKAEDFRKYLPAK